MGRAAREEVAKQQEERLQGYQLRQSMIEEGRKKKQEAEVCCLRLMYLPYTYVSMYPEVLGMSLAEYVATVFTFYIQWIDKFWKYIYSTLIVT